MKFISIYIHIPFCVSKCFYCDFISFANREDMYKIYIEALLLEIKNSSTEYKYYEIQTIFIGGGTPTVIDYNYIIKIMENVKLYYNISEQAEVTIESNPGTIYYKQLLALKNSGINRVSMGLQASQNRLLKKLGRIYTYEEFVESFNLLREAQFDNINIDLMFSLPEQTIMDWEETLSNVIELNPEHISAYSLIIEEGTPFGHMYDQNELLLPDEYIDRQMYYKAKEVLKQNGYIHYEISNFAQNQLESRHNIVYWQQREYIGFGLGAHSYINKMRFHNTYNIDKYIKFSYLKQNITEDIEKNDILDEYAEYMFLGLRLIKGISKYEFKLKFNKNIYDIYGKQLNECKALKLIKEENGNLSLTQKGIDVSNAIFEKFLIK